MIAWVRSAGGALAWGFIISLQTAALAEHPIHFPWGPASQPAYRSHGSVAPASAPYPVLGSRTAGHQPVATIQPTSPKVGYAYGWFGSNATPQATRHLGFHQNYTQWKITP